MTTQAIDTIDLISWRGIADTISVPRREPADSFVLHAPLEFLARLALLPRVRAEHRDEAVARILELGAGFAAAGPPVDPPAPRTFDSTAAAAARLVELIGAGEVDEADAVTAWFGEHVGPSEIGPLLGHALAPLLAAAGHAPIFLSLWPRVCPERQLRATLLRQLVRTLASAPELRIGWIDRPLPPSAGPVSMHAALASMPVLGTPQVEFVHPIVDRIDTDETAAWLAGPAMAAADPAAARDAAREILRAAARTMVDEPGDASPYLWTHCLTMPFAVLDLLDDRERAAGGGHTQRSLLAGPTPNRLLAIAATQVAAFRSGYAQGALGISAVDAPPEPPTGEVDPTDPHAVAAAAWHTAPGDRPALVDQLVQRAAVHRDAHVVKYTVTCLHAATRDREAAHVYLAAAASLQAWWAAGIRS